MTYSCYCCCFSGPPSLAFNAPSSTRLPPGRPVHLRGDSRRPGFELRVDRRPGLIFLPLWPGWRARPPTSGVGGKELLAWTACLKKTEAMASNKYVFFKSAVNKIREFQNLAYPNTVLKGACTFLAATTGNRCSMLSKAWMDVNGVTSDRTTTKTVQRPVVV